MKNTNTLPCVRLTDFVGKEVTLAETPDGYDSSKYPMRVGEKYKVVFVDGSAFCIDIPNFGHAFVYYGRFTECKEAP